ncbi:HEAT repeat domain-containing protein [Chlamydiifrater phoenicopteri]|uniref:HEAT repeat domain-containing protein n=1 Tax=Chlamydiifrater phoenicopteri TaxID=2681469 RepID=UPI001BCD67BA|nr:HEAT repeat domain-containing protein [Chlamydiifrater phoenicopteri]
MEAPLVSEEYSSSEDFISKRLLTNSFADVEVFSKQFLASDSSLKVAELYLRALAARGDFVEWGKEYFRLSLLYPEIRESRDVLEHFSIEVLKRGLKDSSHTVRCLALLASGMAGDFRLVPSILDALDDDNYHVRGLAVQIAAHYPTDAVRKEIERTAFSDRSSFVRSLSYHVCSDLSMKEVIPKLFAVASNHLLVASERREAIRAIAELVDPKEFQRLFAERALGDIEMALFVCEFSATHDVEGVFTLFREYLDHSCLDVKKAVLSAALRKGKKVLSQEKDFIARVRELVKEEFSKELMYTGASILFFVDDPLGEEILSQGLSSSFSRDCEMASESLASLGVYGKDLAKVYLSKVCSQRSAIDLATILLVNRESVDEAGDVVLAFLQSSEKQISSSTRRLLCLGMDKSLPYSDACSASSFQEMRDLELGLRLVRLAILSGYSRSREVLRSFVAERRFFYGGHFLGMFIEDGAEEETKLFLSRMMEDKNFSVKLEAMLLQLRLYGTLHFLESVEAVYADCSWHEKLEIIESIAVSKNRSAIPFLVVGCQESLPTLRVACAGALFYLLK